MAGRNFRAHVAAMSMQDKFREKAIKRANEARARSTLKAGQLDALEAERLLEKKETDALPDDSLPIQLADRRCGEASLSYMHLANAKNAQQLVSFAVSTSEET